MRINVKFRETPETIKLDSVENEKALELKSTELLLQGLKGKDGVSPIVNMEKTNGVTTLTIIDESGPHTTQIYDGGTEAYPLDNHTIITEDGALRVNTTNLAEPDNTLPITSAGTYIIVGNINAILETI